jgi:hypothetical protein
MMVLVVAWIVAGTLAAIGVLHVYWALGGIAGSVKAGASAALPEVGGRPAFTPGPALTLVVAALLEIAAALVALHGKLLVINGLPPALIRVGALGVPVVLAARVLPLVGDYSKAGLRGTRLLAAASPRCASRSQLSSSSPRCGRIRCSPIDTARGRRTRRETTQTPGVPRTQTPPRCERHLSLHAAKECSRSRGGVLAIATPTRRPWRGRAWASGPAPRRAVNDRSSSSGGWGCMAARRGGGGSDSIWDRSITRYFEVLQPINGRTTAENASVGPTSRMTCRCDTGSSSTASSAHLLCRVGRSAGTRGLPSPGERRLGQIFSPIAAPRTAAADGLLV